MAQNTNNQQGQGQVSEPQAPPAQGGGQLEGGGTTGKPPIKAIRVKTKFLNIEITDPNILQEVNTPDKYATNLPFEGLQININKNGGRHLIVTEDRKEVVREIVSGVAPKEIQGEGDQKGLEFFETDRT